MENIKEQIAQIARLIRGELLTDEASRERVSVDGSVFQIVPAAVLHPKDAADIQAVVYYLHSQAKAGKPGLSLTARGRGSDQAGGPLNHGIIVDFTTHLNQILEFGSDFVRVQPGLRYGELQKQLKARGRYLPPYPASIEICTIGGAVANNSSGEKTVKYGDTRDFVQSLKVVVANGDEVLFESQNADQLGAKQKAHGFEGHLYRQVVELLQAHQRSDELPPFHTTKNSTGYCIWGIEKHGHFDLSKLLVGSQGTLGILTEITLRTLPFPAQRSLIAGFFADIDKAALAVEELMALDPSALEIVDQNVIQLVQERKPGYLDGLLPARMPAVVLLCEFDDHELKQQERKAKTTRTILEKYAESFRQETEPIRQERLWDLRRSAAAIIWTVTSAEKALPIVEDGVVPPHLLPEFFKQAKALFEKYGFRIAVWGHAGDANLHMQPFMDLAQAETRAKLWPFMEEFYTLIIGMGGCISAEHNDGLLRSPYLTRQYGPELYAMFEQVKKIFDPYNLFNPGKKIGVQIEDLKPLLRHSYNLDHLVSTSEQINR